VFCCTSPNDVMLCSGCFVKTQIFPPIRVTRPAVLEVRFVTTFSTRCSRPHLNTSVGVWLVFLQQGDYMLRP
jgi:hypothetical protein